MEFGDSLPLTRCPSNRGKFTPTPYSIYVIDVAEGEKIPRKGGPGITRSDLLIINKIDLAPYVGADLGVMERDTNRMRPNSPWVFTNLKKKQGVDEIIEFIVERGMLSAAGASPGSHHAVV